MVRNEPIPYGRGSLGTDSSFIIHPSALSMNWSNVRLIFRREVRDQLRDRRTLFMIAVLPLLLYPLLGMSLFQVAQFIREQPTRVLVLGRDALPPSPPLIEGDRFAERLRGEMEKLHLVELHFAAEQP